MGGCSITWGGSYVHMTSKGLMRAEHDMPFESGQRVGRGCAISPVAGRVTPEERKQVAETLRLPDPVCDGCARCQACLATRGGAEGARTRRSLGVCLGYARSATQKWPRKKSSGKGQRGGKMQYSETTSRWLWSIARGAKSVQKLWK